MNIPEKPVCPYCGSNDVSFVLYGHQAYSEKLNDLLERKVVVLGGCVILDVSEQWLCQDCKETFGELTSCEVE